MLNRFQQMYNSKKITVEQALGLIRSGDEIVAGFCGLEPMAVLSRLHTIKDRVEDVTVWFSLGMGKYEFFTNPELKNHFHTKSWFYSGGIRSAHSLGTVSYQPGHLHNAMTRKLQVSCPRVFIGTATPMDRHGYVKVSLSVLYEKEFIEKADLVIMEINPRLPNVGGDTEIHIRDIDYVIEVDRPIPELPPSEVTEVERTIGAYVASLVNDGDTIQLGIGAIPNAVAQPFMDKHDLGVHTEMITTSMADLAEAGVITGRKKTLHRGKIVGTFALGSQKLYDFLDENPSVILMRGPYVNDPYVIAQNDNMVSINTALQVDLTGQVCSESIGTQHYSGTGGQTDTAVGAIHAKNGRSIIAVYSTAKGGTISTIQPWLSPGAAVTLQRNNVDYVVTEYGIACLKARTIRERVENLIAVAHPDFRAELRETAFKHEIW
ncbi:MAG: acetyl-CoA hydrolase/transferase C-terminal domain-containing protein [Peptococcaceae bacterium]|jgi:acyl-CoA hydrolase|nr:4-hydroxybutyrate--acetyl-CoA CoA transferase [Peptococcaceae bacterium]MDH7525510.1 acetyl-CoA hydrolase/transferase C-terminal domain-containing protein [Peptococcaceae bacterium]